MTQVPNSANYLRAEREAFYAGVRTERLPIVATDSVCVKEGSNKGQFAAVIYLERIDPEPFYLVELAQNGNDIVLPLLHLERVDM